MHMVLISVDALIFIGFFLVGYGTLSLSRAYKLPEPIILLLLGFIAQFFVGGLSLLNPFIVLALIILLFDAGSRFIPRKFGAHELLLSEFIIFSIILNSCLVQFLLYFMIHNKITLMTVLMSLLVGSLITACSQFEILKVFKQKKNRIHYLTELEDHLSNPIVLTISVLVIAYIIVSSKLPALDSLMKVLAAFFVDIAVGIFFGLILLYIVIRVMKRKNVPLTALVFTILTYLVAVRMEGSGFLSVIIMSLFFHNITTRVPDMGEFAPLLSNLVYVFVFITMGYLVKITIPLFIFSIVLLVLYLLFRYILLRITIRSTHFFMTLDCPKGLAVGAMVIFIMTLGEPILVTLFLQQILSSVIMMYALCILISYLANLIKKDIIV